jgi:hypothetical protein
LGKKRESLWRTRKGINTPTFQQSLKCGSARVRHYLSPGAALPHPPRQQKMGKVKLLAEV